jgi:hypothetical protein
MLRQDKLTDNEWQLVARAPEAGSLLVWFFGFTMKAECSHWPSGYFAQCLMIELR